VASSFARSETARFALLDYVRDETYGESNIVLTVVLFIQIKRVDPAGRME